MANVYKKVEVVGSGATIDEAIKNAVMYASRKQKEGDELDWLEVSSVRGHIDKGKISHFQVAVVLGYRIPELT